MADKHTDVSAVEKIKEASRGLRGSLAPELAADTSHFEDAAAQLLKFHGVYQQDDRDTRRQRSDAASSPTTPSWSAARFRAACSPPINTSCSTSWRGATATARCGSRRDRTTSFTAW